MNKTRLEAFSDGVFAIIITIMVLELKVPESTSWEAIRHLLPIFFCYLLSFVFIAIYWGNHHHMMHTVKSVNAGMIWANMHLLFWLSLIPFATGWMGGNCFGPLTVAVYGGLLGLCGISYTILGKTIRKSIKQETELSLALAKSDFKGIASLALYGLSIPLALFVHPAAGCAMFVIVAIMWIIPSKAIEAALEKEKV